MEASQILKSDLLDIIFEGKNKEYGAYDLRKTYKRRITIALVTMVAIIFLIFVGSVIANNYSGKDEAVEMKVKDVSLQQIQPNEPPPPPPPPPPKLPPPPPIATIAFTPPKVVKDEEVIKPPPEVKQIEEAKVDVKTVEGTKDLGIVAPPVEDKGTQVVAAPVEKKEDEDKVFTKVEIEASFPGGASAWTKYVTRAIQSNQDEFTESDFGTCVVKFIVDKTGKVSQVEATTMKGSKLAEVAVNAIRKGPNWTPAQQNGRYVNAYRLQPVTLTNPDQ
ncbi:MAG: energy transducer TonB [Bacteroidota bacterium]|nr:energy transducer TonB [Bacteroidota bacterium]